MADKIRIIYGHLCMTDNSFGFVSFDGKDWKLDEGAWKKECAKVANASANAVRVLPYGVWDLRPFGRKSQFSPWPLDPATNLWDLSRFNPNYFRILLRVVEIANAYGLEAWLPWFDSCQLQPGTWTGMSPWRHNLQGVSHFYDAKADQFVKAWVRRLVKETAGLRVFWPWGNELDQPAFPEWARTVLFPLIKELGIPFEMMTYGATMSEAAYLGNGEFADKSTVQDEARKFFGEMFPPESNKFRLFREVHASGRPGLDAKTPFGHRPHQAAFWWGGKPVGKFVLSDDGVHEWPNPKDGGRPDAVRWKAMATWALQFSNLGGLEHCPEGGDLKYQVGVVAAIGAAYHARFGAWPENTGKWHYDPPPPPPVFIEVTICKATGLIANAYCPEPYFQKYVKGTEPTAVCEIHARPEDPPPPPQDCSCGAWLDTEGGKRKADIWRWLKCVFGGPKRCR